MSKLPIERQKYFEKLNETFKSDGYSLWMDEVAQELDGYKDALAFLPLTDADIRELRGRAYVLKQVLDFETTVANAEELEKEQAELAALDDAEAAENDNAASVI